MKNLFFKWLLLIAFLVISSVNLLAQVNWTKYPEIQSYPLDQAVLGIVDYLDLMCYTILIL